MRTIAGHVTREGYTIEDCLTGETLYRGGNSRLDSTYITFDGGRLSQRTLIRFCEQTGKEIASELNARFVGVSSN